MCLIALDVCYRWPSLRPAGCVIVSADLCLLSVLLVCREGEDCPAEGKAHHTGFLSSSSNAVRMLFVCIVQTATQLQQQGLHAAAV
jgi:hypothetical protein